MRRQETLEAFQIGRDDLQHEIYLAVQHMAFAHLGQRRDMRFKGGEIGLRLAPQAHHREDGDGKAQLRGIAFGVIAADHPGLLKRANAPQAWRRGKADAIGQLNVGHAPIFLKICQNLPVDPVEHCFLRLSPRTFMAIWLAYP